MPITSLDDMRFGILMELNCIYGAGHYGDVIIEDWITLLVSSSRSNRVAWAPPIAK